MKTTKSTRWHVLAVLLLVSLVPGLVLAQAEGWSYYGDWYYRYGGTDVYAGPDLLMGQVADGTINRWRGVQIDASGGLIQAVAADDTELIGVAFGGKTYSSGDEVLVAVRGETDAQVQGPVVVNDALKVGYQGRFISRSPSTTYGAFTGESNEIGTQPGATGTITATADVAATAVITTYGVTGVGAATSMTLSLSAATSVTGTLSFQYITAMELDAAESTATITVTSGSMSVVFTPGQVQKGFATLTTAQTQGHNLQLNTVADGATTKYVVVRGLDQNGAAANEVFTMNGTTSVAGSGYWSQIDQIEVGHLENTRTATFTHDDESGAVVGKVLEAGSNNDTVLIYLEPDKAVTSSLIPYGSIGTDQIGDNLSLDGTLTVAGATALNGGLTMDTTAFTVADATGNTTIGGTLDVQGGDITLENDETIGNSGDGIIDLDGALDVQGGDITLENDETIGNGSNGIIDLGGAVRVSAGNAVYPEDATNASAEFACVNTVAYTDVTSKTMCVLPANVDIVDISFVVTTAFDDSGTDVVDCGTSPQADPDDYVDGIDASAAGVNRMGDAADMPYATLGDVGASDVTVACLYTGQNSNASAGAATLRITYVVR